MCKVSCSFWTSCWDPFLPQEWETFFWQYSLQHCSMSWDWIPLRHHSESPRMNQRTSVHGLGSQKQEKGWHRTTVAAIWGSPSTWVIIKVTVWGLSGVSTPTLVGRKRGKSWWTKARTAPGTLWSLVQFEFSFYTLKSQGELGKQARFYRSIRDCRQGVRGNDPLFLLFFQVILLQIASKVVLGRHSVQTVL